MLMCRFCSGAKSQKLYTSDTSLLSSSWPRCLTCSPPVFPLSTKTWECTGEWLKMMQTTRSIAKQPLFGNLQGSYQARSQVEKRLSQFASGTQLCLATFTERGCLTPHEFIFGYRPGLYCIFVPILYLTDNFPWKANHFEALEKPVLT